MRALMDYVNDLKRKKRSKSLISLRCGESNPDLLGSRWIVKARYASRCTTPNWAGVPTCRWSAHPERVIRSKLAALGKIGSRHILHKTRGFSVLRRPSSDQKTDHTTEYHTGARWTKPCRPLSRLGRSQGAMWFDKSVHAQYYYNCTIS